MKEVVEWIRKFGLEYCDLPTMIWNISILMKPLFLNIDNRSTKKIPLIMYILSPFAACCFVYVFTFSTMWFVFVRSVELGEIIYRRVVLSLACSSHTVVVKLFFLYMNSSNVNKLVDEYITYDAQLERGSRFYKNSLKNLRIVKKRVVLLWTILVTNGAIYMLKTLLKPGRHVLDENFPLYGLEPVLETPNYELNFVAMTFAIICCLHIPIAISGFIIIITGYIESQMIALGQEVEAIWLDAGQHYKNTYLTSDHDVFAVYDEDIVKNLYVKQVLRNISRKHAGNITLLRQTERVFRNAFVGEFIILIISLISVLIGGLEYTYIEVPFAFTQVALDCLAGQKVIDAGIVFEHALYNSKWENFDIPNRKMIVIMLMNSQKTLSLSAGGIAVLNYPCLMTVIRSVYSAYTTLHSAIQNHSTVQKY